MAICKLLTRTFRSVNESLDVKGIEIKNKMRLVYEPDSVFFKVSPSLTCKTDTHDPNLENNKIVTFWGAPAKQNFLFFHLKIVSLAHFLLFLLLKVAFSRLIQIKFRKHLNTI